MTDEGKRRGRPPKAASDLKRNSPKFYCTDDLLEALQKAARENGHQISNEIEARLSQSFGIKQNLEKEEAEYYRSVVHIFGGQELFENGVQVGLEWNRALDYFKIKSGKGSNWYDDLENLLFIQDYMTFRIKGLTRRFFNGARREAGLEPVTSNDISDA